MRNPAEEKVAPIAVSPADAARILRVCRATIYNLIAAGDIASVKIGRSRRIPISELARVSTPKDVA
jgi:excisionase family DNA binding protein